MALNILYQNILVATYVAIVLSITTYCLFDCEPVTDYFRREIQVQFGFWFYWIIRQVGKILSVVNMTWALGFGNMFNLGGMFASNTSINILISQLHEDSHAEMVGRCVDRQMKTYRVIGVYTAAVNSCFKSWLAPCTKAIIVLVCILSSCVLCKKRLRQTLNSWLAMTLIYGLIYCYFLVLWVYGLPGKANSKSILIAQEWKRNMVRPANSTAAKSRREKQKMIRSMQELRIKFGPLNFYGRNTALRLIDFIWNQTMSLLMIN